MNKAELINVIAERVGVTKKQAEDMIESFVKIVTQELVKDGDVTIAGFGQFMAKTRAGRTGVNPQNPTEKIQIPPVRVPKFKAGKGLKDALKAPRAAAAPTPEPPAAAPETPSYM
ncbi:HU family DNA-binding protein [Patescibacteria group bacterium]|nr:HU family DNA-binding protein [Patescibacteria group bacterium]